MIQGYKGGEAGNNDPICNKYISISKQKGNRIYKQKQFIDFSPKAGRFSEFLHI